MKRARRGFTVTEVLVAAGLALLVLTLLGISLSLVRRLLQTTTSASDSSLRLRGAYLDLSSELRETSFSHCRVLAVPGSGRGLLGDAVWFCSGQDPATGRTLRGGHGGPHWQRNILYYPAIPGNHDELYGVSCPATDDADGYDVGCSHKILVRKVIDSPPATPSDPNKPPEELLSPTDIVGYISDPSQLMMSPTGPNGQEDAKLAAQQMVSFRASMHPSSAQPSASHIKIAMVSLSAEEAQSQARPEGRDASNLPGSEAMEFSVYPESR